MSENLKKFLDMLASDKELEAKALACNELGEEKGKEAMLALAKECGFELSAADFEEKAESTSRELDDDELDAVAGGACGCAFAGGGKGNDAANGKQYQCSCVLYGLGKEKKGDSNCSCYISGGGNDTNDPWANVTD